MRIKVLEIKNRKEKKRRGKRREEERGVRKVRKAGRWEERKTHLYTSLKGNFLGETEVPYKKKHQ